MSAVWLKVTTILCLSCTALSGPEERGGVVWRDFGGTVTIHCRASESDQQSLSLKKGLKEDYEVLFRESYPAKDTIAKDFTGRLQVHGVNQGMEFPNVSILIKNLTSDDTGPYWCIYSKFDLKSGQLIQKKGTGSVLLVVTEQCDPANNNLVLVSVVISAAVFLAIIMGLFIWIIKTKSSRSTVEPRRVANNDDNEDMRETLSC